MAKTKPGTSAPSGPKGGPGKQQPTNPKFGKGGRKMRKGGTTRGS